MPWQKSYHDADVLDAAARAFWARGYEATSMADLVKATGINRGSIYSGFTDKRTLFLKSLEYYHSAYCADYLASLAECHPPVQAIETLFREASNPSASQPSGCLLVNTALELCPHDTQIAAFVDTCMTEVEDFFHGLIIQAMDAGDIAARRDPRHTAQALLGLFLGLRVLVQTNPQQSARDAIRAQARALLVAAETMPGR